MRFFQPQERQLFEQIFNCRLKGDDKMITVSGLKKAREFDPFDNLQVHFSGNNGAGHVEQEKGWEETGLSFTAFPDTGLKNGDQITVFLSLPDRMCEAEYVSGFGLQPKYMEKTYRVSGLTR